MKRYIIGFSWLMAAYVAVAGAGTSNEFKIDTRSGDRVSAGSEELTFSNLWDGDADATVTIAQDGAAIFEGLSGEGVKTWSVNRNGRYVLTHTTYTNGVKGKVETAVFVVEGKDVPVGGLTIDWGQKSFVYDGQPKEPVITVKDGATTLTKNTHYLVEYKDNVNVGTAKAIVKGIEPYVEEVTNTFTITQGALPPGDDPDPTDPSVDPDDPEQREDPTIPFSAFDYVGKYDGEAHTIDTNALKQAWMAALGSVTVGYATASNGAYQATAFAFKDAIVTSFWYKVSSANYADIVKPCKVAITNRLVTLTSGSKEWTYDSLAHSNLVVTVSGDGFVSGEGVTTNGFATITDVGSVPNAFAYSFLPGMLAANYAVTCVTGMLTVVKSNLPPGDDPDPLPPGVDPDDPEQRDDPDVRFSKFDYVGKYDGAYHTIDTNSLKQAWTAALGSVTVGYATASNGIYQTDAFAFKDAIVTSFWYKVTSANYSDVVKPCKVAITNRLVTLTSGTDQWTFDGNAHSNMTVTVGGDGFVLGEGVTTNGFASITDVGSVPNAFSYSFLPNTLAANYAVTCVTGMLTITAAPIGPGGGEEPGAGEVPEGGLSKFDATYVYDGEGHTINTQALYAVTLVGSTPSFSFSLDGETGWQNDPFVYTNVGEYVMWYKITAPNYADYKHQAKVTIQPLVLTVTFDANGGSCPMASKTVTHGATYGTLPTPTWTGHIFAGWYTAASGGDEVKDSATVSIMAPQTLSAHWVSVTGVSAKQRYPWNGLVDIAVTFAGESNDVAKVDCSFIATNSATKAELSVATITRKGADSGKDNDWSRQFVWNAGADVGAVKIDDVTFMVVANIPLEGGVQLWENGPYWAEYNVGAMKPEERGYYFMWGDTVGYKRNGDGWDAADGSKIGFSFDYGKCKTFGMSVSSLVGEGYVDLSGNLVAAHDAATAYLGAPWRMPTDAELSALIDNCKILWTTQNSVYGCLVVGKGSYSSSRIFLPAGGYGSSSNLRKMDVVGFYWSSTLDSGDSTAAGELGFNSEKSYHDNGRRELGQSVRPLRDLVVSSACVSKLHFSLDCRTGDRVSAGSEELTFSNLWDGDAEATVTIAQDGAAIFAGLGGEGVKLWTVDRNGRYELTHTTYTNGIKGKVETAVFVVEGKEVPVSELTIDWGQKSFVYDGQPKEPVITVKDRGTTLAKGTHYIVEYKDNVNVGTAKAIVKGIEPYVEEVTNSFTITKGSLPPDVDPDPTDPSVDPEDPGQREDPAIPFSKFDYVGMYDGAYHTIDTNALKQAWMAVLGSMTVGYSTASNGAYQATAFAFKDVGVTSFWYKVSSANYADIVKPCKVAITNRLVTFASGSQEWTYDSMAHSNVTVTVSGDGFVSGEGVTTNGFATITDVGSVPNAFAYSFLPNTLAANYSISCVTGVLTVTQGTLPPGDDPDPTDPSVNPDDPEQRDDPDVRFSKFDYVAKYDGAYHTIDTNGLVAAYEAVLGAGVACMYSRARDGEWSVEPLVFKDAIVTSFWYKVTSANYSDIVKPCKVAITNRLVTLTSGTKIDFAYDGKPHAFTNLSVTAGSFVAGEGIATSNWATVTEIAEGEVANSFDYAPIEGTKLSNYDLTIVTGKIAVVKGDLPPAVDPDPTDPSVDPDDPEQREDPDVRFSKFDYVGMYDGEAHTIDTNALKQAWMAALGSVTVGYATASNGAYQATAFAFKDSVVTSFWYKVTSANYSDIVKPCKVAVTNRLVTLTSGTDQWTFDGNAHSNITVTVGGDGFVSGEGVTTNGFAIITDVGSVPNSFSYSFLPNTLSANYSISVVTGILTIAAAPVPTDWDMIPTESYFGEYAMVEGHVMSVTNPPNIEFDLATEQWKLGFIVKWPGGPGNYTPPEDAKIRLSTSGRTFTGADILAGDTDGELLSIETNRFGYVAFVTWETYLTPEDVYFAHEDGEIDFKYVMTAGAGTSDLRPEGIADSDFTLVIPLGNLELRDINGYRVYPVHLHTWTFTPMLGYMLAANCTSDPEYELECPTPESVVLSLGDSPISRFIYTGRPVSFELYNADAFRYRTGAIVGGVVYCDSDGMALEGAPSEVGEYTAEVTVTPMGASPVTLRRSFTIFSLFNASLESEAPTLLGVTRDEARQLRIVDLRLAPKVRFGMTVGGATANLPLKLSSEQVAPFVQVTTDLSGKWEAIRPERMTIDFAGRVTITPEADRLTEFYRFAVPLGD